MAMACIGAPPCACAATKRTTTAPKRIRPQRNRHLKGVSATAGEDDSITWHASTRAPKRSCLPKNAGGHNAHPLASARLPRGADLGYHAPLLVAYPADWATQRPAKPRGVSRWRNPCLTAERARSHEASEGVRASLRAGVPLGSG